ncbi:MAG: hypothetical protein KDA45_01425 [Planctomycetales bacterium]|nr:hypothetical protein [Planctomycetales bacterium]
MLADHVQILSGGREHSRADDARSMQQQEQRYQRVTIGRGAWIGAGAIVMADVGAGAIVGAGAVVNRPIPAHHLAAGVPARVLKPLNGNARAKGTAPTTRQTAPINSASQLR